MHVFSSAQVHSNIERKPTTRPTPSNSQKKKDVKGAVHNIRSLIASFSGEEQEALLKELGETDMTKIEETATDSNESQEDF